MALSPEMALKHRWLNDLTKSGPGFGEDRGELGNLPGRLKKVLHLEWETLIWYPFPDSC